MQKPDAGLQARIRNSGAFHMTFFGIGALEAMVILVVALLILGPGRLPEVMGEAGRTLREFRRMTKDLTGDLEGPISEIRSSLEEVQGEFEGTVREITRETKGIGKTITGTVDEAVQDVNPVNNSSTKSTSSASSRSEGVKKAPEPANEIEPVSQEATEKTASREDPLADLVDLDEEVLSSNGSKNSPS